MLWLKRDMWKVGISLASLLLLLILMVWIPMSAADAHAGTSEFATPTVDLTVTALAKEQLALQVKQLQNQDNWLVNSSTALIAAAATVIVALFGILQWAITVRQAQDKESRDRGLERQKEIAAQDKELRDRQAAQDKDLRNRRDAQDKELRDRAEERFKVAVTTLGDEKEGTQIGGAILLRSFLHKDDEEIYGRYYTQIFDLAVAYLRLRHTNGNQEKFHSAFSQALTVTFKEAFPLVRKQSRSTVTSPQSLDASLVWLNSAYLATSDLSLIWMPGAHLKGANLSRTNLRGSDLREADLSQANLNGTDLRNANLSAANLSQADLSGADLSGADLRRANLTKVVLGEASLSGTQLAAQDQRFTTWSGLEVGGQDLTRLNLRKTDLRGVYGLTNEELAACKIRGAIIGK